MNDGLDDHPDLADLGWSKREERRALRRARPPRPRPGAAFLRKHRVKVVSVGGVLALLVAGVVLISGIDRSATADRSGLDLTRPFEGTPAADWPEGAAGIVAPDPVALGPHTAEQVAGAYAAVRQLLITARLDRSVIVEHENDALQQHLAPPAPLPDGLATRVSDDFRLLPVEPRVRGWMKAELDQNGALVVRTDYVVAYAFDTDEPDRLMHPTELVAIERLATDVTVVEQGLWPVPVAGFAYSMACTAYKDGVLAPVYSERIVTDRDAEDGERMLDPNQPMPTTSTCPD